MYQTPPPQPPSRARPPIHQEAKGNASVTSPRLRVSMDANDHLLSVSSQTRFLPENGFRLPRRSNAGRSGGNVRGQRLNVPCEAGDERFHLTLFNNSLNNSPSVGIIPNYIKFVHLEPGLSKYGKEPEIFVNGQNDSDTYEHGGGGVPARGPLSYYATELTMEGAALLKGQELRDNTGYCSRVGCVRPLSLFYSDASADGVEERSLVPRSRSRARLRRNATMSHAFSCVQPALIDL
ncbi:hypothetical protein EVAR_35572_1 [Eumeta japonica]|uniref:Uncharacterized protein n=1 Tax=Eumeta variegata TaxID=151549 RepID=A0A4C1XM16_EUMVA|nr:hypothetical protein EVAR_35572_1 [Eumeta japonica]